MCVLSVACIVYMKKQEKMLVHSMCVSTSKKEGLVNKYFVICTHYMKDFSVTKAL